MPPTTVTVNAADFTAVVRSLLSIVMSKEPQIAGPALLVAYVLQLRGYDLGPKECVSQDIVTLVNRWLETLEADI